MNDAPHCFLPAVCLRLHLPQLLPSLRHLRLVVCEKLVLVLLDEDLTAPAPDFDFNLLRADHIFLFV